jgi:hypothetical protein
MSDILFGAVQALVDDESPFTLALRNADGARAALAGALEAVQPAFVRAAPAGSSAAVGLLEAMLRRRLLKASAAGELPQHLSVNELTAFYTSIMIGLVEAALNDGSAATLAAIRRTALDVWQASLPGGA